MKKTSLILIVLLSIVCGGWLGIKYVSTNMVPSFSNLLDRYLREDVSDWKVYKNTKHGYEIMYPANWIVEGNDTPWGHYRVSFIGQQVEQLGETDGEYTTVLWQVAVNVFAGRAEDNPQELPLQEWYLTQPCFDFCFDGKYQHAKKDHAFKEITINGLPALMVRSKLDSDYIVYIAKGSAVYTLSYYVDTPGEYPFSLEEVFLKMVTSFKLN